MDLALNIIQRLICHKKPKQPTNQLIFKPHNEKQMTFI